MSILLVILASIVFAYTIHNVYLRDHCKDKKKREEYQIKCTAGWLVYLLILVWIMRG